MRELCKHPEYTIRAITRDSSSAAARALAGLPNVTLVEADFSDPSTLAPAFIGAEAVYAVTNFYDPKVQEDTLEEARQGCAMVDVAKEANVKLFIWSTIPSALVRTGARFDSPRLVENKFTVSQYLKYRQVPHVDLYVGFYMDNWINFRQLSKAPDGALEITQPKVYPETALGMVWVQRDLGRVVASILDKLKVNSSEVINHSFYCVGGQYSTNDLKDRIEEEFECISRVITPSTSGYHDLDVMYGYYNVWGVYRDVEIPHPPTLELGIRFSSLADFVKEGVLPVVKSLQ